MSLWGRIFATLYDPVLRASERAGLTELRAGLLAEATGRTLELGAGTGLNLALYPDTVTELVLSEPEAPMAARLEARVRARAGSAQVVRAGAEALPFADGSFDTVVGTYVLCTVPEPARALAEIVRVLAPGGRLLFLEHVHAGEGTALGRIQDLVELPHRYLAAGCHPNRRTAALLEASELEIERLEHGRQPRAVPTVRPTIIGAARRA